MTANGLVLSDDLIFFSRIEASARAAGLIVRQARTPADLLKVAQREPPTAVLLDLQNPDLNLLSLLDDLKAACPSTPRVVAYGPHVDVEALRAAREAGCYRVLSRSQFVKEVEHAIRDWLTVAAPE